MMSSRARVTSSRDLSIFDRFRPVPVTQLEYLCAAREVARRRSIAATALGRAAMGETELLIRTPPGSPCVSQDELNGGATPPGSPSKVDGAPRAGGAAQDDNDPATQLLHLVGEWTVVWVLSPALFEQFLEERNVPAAARRILRHFPRGTELRFSIEDGCWCETNLSTLPIFSKTAPVPIGGAAVRDKRGAWELMDVAAWIEKGCLVQTETPLGGVDPSSRAVTTRLEAVRGNLLRKRVTNVATGTTFELIMARSDVGSHHRGQALKRELEAPGHERERAILAFMPAMLFFPVWAYAMVRGQLWRTVYSKYWPMASAMIMGSFIAGSTPLGGGVVGFPVAVLALGFDPAKGRDFSAMIQSVGMTAAAYLIIYLKPDLIEGKLVASSIVFGTLGVILGFIVPVDPFAVNLTLTTYLLAFAVVYFYKNELIERHFQPGFDGETWDEDQVVDDAEAARRRAAEARRDRYLAVSGVFGGFVTAKLGSGSDSMAYVFAAFAWNLMTPWHRISESSMTASTVIVMATMSIVVMGVRFSTGTLSEEVIHCWAAAAPVVCFGAPTGALVLGPRAEIALRRFFYFIAAVQFVVFGLIVIKTHVVGWTIVATCLGFTTLATVGHYHLRLMPQVSRQRNDAALRHGDPAEGGGGDEEKGESSPPQADSEPTGFELKETT